MSEDTRNEVIQLARKLGYRTKEQDRSWLAQGMSPYDGQQKRIMIILHIYSSINTLLLSSLQETIGRFGGRMEISIIPHSLPVSKVSMWAEERNILYADGLIIVPRLPEAIQEKIVQLPVPKILINYPNPSYQVDSVIWDVYSSVYQSTKYLIQAGHNRIMYIGNITEQRGYRFRWHAFCDAMREENLDVEPEHHFFHKVTNDQAIFTGLSKKIQLYSPTAILSSTGISWTYFICNKLNKAIPEDISLISCNLSEKAEAPNLTCYKFRVKEVGERAVERILWRIANPNSPFEHVCISGDLIEGGSVLRL